MGFEREFKAKIAEAEGNIGQASREYEVVVNANNKIHKEMDELNGILNSGGAAVQATIDKTKQCEEAMKDTKKQLASSEARVMAEKENTASIMDAQKKVEGETAKFRGEMKKLEAKLRIAKKTRQARIPRLQHLVKKFSTRAS